MKRIDKFIFHLFFGLSSWHILSMRVALVKDAAQFLAYFFYKRRGEWNKAQSD